MDKVKLVVLMFFGLHSQVHSILGGLRSRQLGGIPTTWSSPCGIRFMPQQFARIVGGRTSKPGELPWVVYLESMGQPLCGGTILSERWVITAAHCLLRSTGVIRVIAGQVDSQVVTPYTQTSLPLYAAKAPGFNGGFNADIALIRLAIPLQWSNYVQPICLPEPELPERKSTKYSGFKPRTSLIPQYRVNVSEMGEPTMSLDDGLVEVHTSYMESGNGEPQPPVYIKQSSVQVESRQKGSGVSGAPSPNPEGNRNKTEFTPSADDDLLHTEIDFVGEGLIAGWGWQDELGTLQSTILQQLQIPIINPRTCGEWYKQGGYPAEINENLICAGVPEGGKDACLGDSGGPLFEEKNGRFSLVGIIAGGQGCARPNLPGVYVNVKKFLPWIRSMIRF